jgi:hypothetical protein
MVPPGRLWGWTTAARRSVRAEKRHVAYILCAFSARTPFISVPGLRIAFLNHGFAGKYPLTPIRPFSRRLPICRLEKRLQLSNQLSKQIKTDLLLAVAQSFSRVGMYFNEEAISTNGRGSTA